MRVTQLHTPEEIVPVILYEPDPPPTLTPPAHKPATPKKVAPAPIEKAPVESTPELPPPPGSLTLTASVITADTVETKAESAPIPHTLSTRLPPSVDYWLDVVRTEPKLSNSYYGSGEIRWSHDKHNYNLYIDIGIDILFATVRLYSLQSSGTIASGRIKPHSLTEARRNKPVSTTNFDYDTYRISFQNSDASIPLLDNAQDKATVLIQLAGIGNADPSQLQPGKTISMQIAEDKEANTHQCVVLDYETIETKLGRLSTLHIVRLPAPGNTSSRIDIWLAPELNWLPVQVRNTEANGAITTQTIRKIISGINDEDQQ